MRFTVVYDACVLYPAPLRDFLLRLATAELFAAKYIEAIHPDIFTEQQLDLNEGKVLTAVKAHRAALHKPRKDVGTYLETLSAQGLVVTAERLASFRALI